MCFYGNHHTMTTHETCSPAGLCTQHFNEHTLHTEPCLVPNECYSSPASRSDSWIMSTSCLKGALAINMFAPKGAAYSHGCIITLRAEASGKKQWELCELLFENLQRFALRVTLREPTEVCSTSLYSSRLRLYGTCSTNH